MAEYIEKKKVLEQLEDIEYREPSYHHAGEMIKAVRDMPTADVRPVVHGHYIGDFDGYADGSPVYDIWSCSVCGCYFEDWDDKPTYKFCPNCGARMGGVSNA